MNKSNISYQKSFRFVIVTLFLTILMSCSYSDNTISYPIEFKYATVSVEYEGISDTLKPIIADSINASIARAGFILTPSDSLKSNNLLIVKGVVVKKGAGFGIALSFYPQGGIISNEIYFSDVNKDDPIATIKAQSSIPFAEEYNLRKTIDILNNGLINKGGIKTLFAKV